jgi:hypothetical protein
LQQSWRRGAWGWRCRAAPVLGARLTLQPPLLLLPPGLQGLEATIEAREVRLVVIDSIAALLRLDFQGREGMGERQELLGRQAAALKLLAERHNIPVLVTNQVRGAAGRCRWQRCPPAQQAWAPRLGPCWAPAWV